MNTEKIIESLRKLPDAEFERSLNSPWHKYPAELVRNELVRRLKLRSDLSFEAKKFKYKEIIDRFLMVNHPASADRFRIEFNELDETLRTAIGHYMELRNARIEDINEKFRQLGALHSQREDAFEGKAKPGDWRPVSSDLCPVCGGSGKGADNRMCGKCIGRGFIRR